MILRDRKLKSHQCAVGFVDTFAATPIPNANEAWQLIHESRKKSQCHDLSKLIIIVGGSYKLDSSALGSISQH